MVFSSLVFLCVFLPVTFLLALVVRNITVQNWLLIAASLLFYAYGEPIYVLLMIGTSAFTYLMARLIGVVRPSRRKLVCVISVVACLGSLGLFKYADWIVLTINGLIGADIIPAPQLALPIGISFYTFQALSYTVDVYRKDVPAQTSFSRVLLYISFFPQLIAGPIIRYHDVDEQLGDRRITFAGVQTGLKRFCVGLAKKVLIADVMAKCADAIFAMDPSGLNMPLAWIGALAYLLQIYFDFSGYSDMAIGMARMFGFTYKENFNYPYISTSIKEFWRRWHISLSTWLKEYLYIPLGGNRKGRPRTVLNKILVFVCCGLWHGAAWTFLVWGLIHGLFLLIEEYAPVHKLPKPLGWLYCMLVVTLAFVLFRADTLEQGVAVLSAMFTGGFSWQAASWVTWCAQTTPLFWFTFIVGIVAAFPWLPALKERLLSLPRARRCWVGVVTDIICVLLFVICLLTLAGGAYSPFIYFRF